MRIVSLAQGLTRKADRLAVAARPFIFEDVFAADHFLCGEKKEPRAAGERPALHHEVPPPLLARRHGEDPEVRDAEVPPVKALPPGLPVSEELAPEGGLIEPLPRDRHGAPVSFEEEVGAPSLLRRAGEPQTEDPIRFYPEAVELAALLDLYLPAEG